MRKGDRSKPETIRQRSIVDALRAIGRVVLRLHAGRVRARGGYMVNNEAGTPDLHVVPNFYLETKTESGELSAVQRRVHAKLRRAGGVVKVVRTPLEAVAFVRSGVEQ